MAGKKTGKRNLMICAAVLIILAILAALAVLGFVVIKKGLLPLPEIGNREEGRTTQTISSKRSEKRLMEFISIEDMEIGETEYGFLELSAVCKLPDYSAYFEQYKEDAAEKGDAAAFEKRLFARTAEALKADNRKASVPYVTRELVVDLSAVDISRGKDEWKEKELEALLRQAAFEEELEEFAMDIMSDYLSQTIDWEEEKIEQTDEAAGEEEVQAP